MTILSLGLFLEDYEMYASEIAGILDRWDILTPLMKEFYTDKIRSLLLEGRPQALQVPGMAEKLEPFDQLYAVHAPDIERLMGIQMPDKENRNG